jgi:hypothetical protein
MMMKRLRSSSTLGILLIMAAPAVAQEQSGSTFVLIPTGGGPVAQSGYFGLQADDSAAILNTGIFAPLGQNGSNLWMYDLSVSAIRNEESGAVAGFASAGLLYRTEIAPGRVLGFNLYLDHGREAASDAWMTGASLGAEYQAALGNGWSFLQVGGNLYAPLGNYTDAAAFPLATAAPRRGADLYVSYGRDDQDVGLWGTLTAFSYAEDGDVASLSGYRADLEVDFRRGLPDGTSLRGKIGVRDDNRSDSGLDVVAGLTLDWTFGAPTARRTVAPDCAAEQDDAAGIVSCDTGRVSSAASRGTRVERPRRNIAFGTPFVPLEPVRVAGPVTATQTLQICVPPSGLGADFVFTLTSSTPALNGTLIFNSGGCLSAINVANSEIYNLTIGASKEFLEIGGGVFGGVFLVCGNDAQVINSASGGIPPFDVEITVGEQSTVCTLQTLIP